MDWYFNTSHGHNRQDTYPDLIGKELGAIVYNESLGSSMVRNSNYLGTIKGMYWEPVLKSLSATIAEKQSVLDHWSSGLDANGVITVDGTYG